MYEDALFDYSKEWTMLTSFAPEAVYTWKNILPIDNRRTFKQAFRFLCFCREDLSNTPRVACYRGAWLVYTQSFFSESMGSWFRWPRIKGTAKQLTSFTLFCWFLPNPVVQDLFLWRTSQEFFKDGFISIVTRPLISLRYVVCFDRVLVDNRPLCQSLQTV